MENAARNAAYYASEYPGVSDFLVYGYKDLTDSAADDVEQTLDASQLTVSLSSTTDSNAVPVKIVTVTYPFAMVSGWTDVFGGNWTSATVTRSVTMRLAPVLPNN
jgi:hypothetical protein